MCIYKYNVSYYNDVESKTVEEWGLLTAESWGDATTKLERYYGSDLEKFSLECVGDGSLINFRTEDEATVMTAFDMLERW